MADESKVSFLLDLDIKEFTEKGLQAKGIIEKLGSEENLSGLLEGLTAAAPLLAGAGIAAFAFKKSLDLTLEAEQIERVNTQFETLSLQAGIGPRKLKEGLEEAAKGLVDTDDLLKISNEAIVKMGHSAEKLPEIMEIARKATTVYGGDAKSNFEQISNAIANGNTKILKHYGILVDTVKAEREFAAANGTTADQLSEVGKRQAILNAALEAGNNAFKGVTENSESATTVLQSLKVTFSEIGQAFTLAFEKTIGPGVRAFLGSVSQMATKLKLTLQSEIGDGAEKAAAKLHLTKDKISEIEKELQRLQAIKGTAMDFAPGETQVKIQGLTKALTGYRNELEKVETQVKAIETADNKATSQELANASKKAKESIVDQEKAKKNRQEYQKFLDKAEKDIYNEQVKNVKSLTQVQQLALKQREFSVRQHNAAITAIENNHTLDKDQKLALIAAENKRFEEQMLHDEEDALNQRSKLLDNYVANNKKDFAGIEAAFRANTEKMKVEQADFGKRGNEMWNSLSSNASSAFQQMGAQMAQGKDIATATADAMRGVFLGMLGDRAIAEGQVMLLASIMPPNPAGLAGGAALLALGGALKAAAGASAAPTTAAAGPSPQSSASGSAPPLVPVSSASSTASASASNDQATSNMDQQQKSQRTVQVNIAGNYLETDQTKRMLMDLMRQESDATGFQYNQIGA